MGVGEIAGLIAAIAFAVLAGFMIYPLIRLGKLFDQIAQADPCPQLCGQQIHAADLAMQEERLCRGDVREVAVISDGKPHDPQTVQQIGSAEIKSRPLSQGCHGEFKHLLDQVLVVGRRIRGKIADVLHGKASPITICIQTCVQQSAEGRGKPGVQKLHGTEIQQHQPT